MIGEQIKKFRIKRGITQEELGSMVGVTTQAVSKWERGGVPDAELLPAIADALDISIEMLFGRQQHQSSEDTVTGEILAVNREEGFRKAFSLLWAIDLGLSGLGTVKEHYGRDILDNLKDKNGNHLYSRVSLDEGLIDARMNTDSRYFFLMPEPEEGYSRYFDNLEELSETFSLLADQDALKILFYMYTGCNVPMSLSLIAVKTKLAAEKADRLLDRLCKVGLVVCTEVQTEAGSMKAYNYFNETVLIPLLCFAKELRDKKVINWAIMFDRKKPLF